MTPHLAIDALAQWPTEGLIAVISFFGLLVGSMLNVVIHRIPVMMQRAEDNYIASVRGEDLPHPEKFNLFVPRSACPDCGTPVRPQDNIPVVSYLLLRGRCRSCKTPIPARYPLVEIAAAVLAGLVAARFGPTWPMICALGIVWTLLALTVIDARTQLLPDSLTLPLLWAGLIANINELFAPLADAVIGAAAGYLILWSVYWLFRLLRGKEGMGYGDFKLMAALGAWFGWQALPSLVLLSSLAGAAYGIAMILLRRQGRETAFSFGPFIAAAGLLQLLLGVPLLRLFGHF